jgi:hypothetical protein
VLGGVALKYCCFLTICIIVHVCQLLHERHCNERLYHRKVISFYSSESVFAKCAISAE